MWRSRLAILASMLMAAALTVPAWAAGSNAKSALPGTLNYVEGQAAIGDESLDSKSIGSAELKPGESLTTENGKAEILLTPGVFLRIGNNSSVKMISPSLTDTELALEKGHAMVEVAEIHPENDIRITEDGATAKLLKTGLYDFDQKRNEFRVFDGKAYLEDDAGRATVKGGHEVSLTDSKPKAEKFDKKSYEEGDLYRWSSLRSGYLAEANVDAAGIYAANGWGAGFWGPGWLGAAWYWDPWFDAYTFIPGEGIFYSPFGWGFYSPWLVPYAPYYGYGHYYHHFSRDYHNWGPGGHYVAGSTYAHGVYRGPGAARGGFHAGPSGSAQGFARSSGGGFHGGEGGGFHGGGFGGGGFHR